MRGKISNVAIYIEMLRGINIGPHKRMKMEKLRASFEALGFRQVKTYIQSGNVIFKAAKLSPATLSKKIEERIVSDFGFSVEVISRTRDEMNKIIQSNSLLKARGLDSSKLHVAFLWDAPTAAAVKQLDGPPIPPDRPSCSGHEIFFSFPKRVAAS